MIDTNYCELCEDGEDCVYCWLAGAVKCEGRWVEVDVMLDPCVQTPGMEDMEN